MNEVDRIIDFFDKASVSREYLFNKNRLLQYEQNMRHRAVLELLDPTPGERLLDVGAGNLRDSIPLIEKGLSVYSLDISMSMLTEGLKNYQGDGPLYCVQGSAVVLPFPSAYFDKILCSEVIEHIPNYEFALFEFNRCLKPGGKLVITTPNWNSLYGLNRKFVETIRRIFKTDPWYGHPYDNWKTYEELSNKLKSCHFIPQKWLGICYLPGFSFGSFLPGPLQTLVIYIVQQIESQLRYKLPKYGYGLGVLSQKVCC